jgi:hypothetical protein
MVCVCTLVLGMGGVALGILSQVPASQPAKERMVAAHMTAPAKDTAKDTAKEHSVAEPTIQRASN